MRFPDALPWLLGIYLLPGCGSSDSSIGTGSPISSSDSHPPPPRTNSLGMVFVPVSGTKVQFCAWETRVQDFATFVDATGYDATGDMFSLANGGFVKDGRNWKNPGFEQGPTHPVAGVSWNDAKAFCAWLTKREQEQRVIQTNQIYRLPSDAEWSSAIGLTHEDGNTPEEKHQRARALAWKKGHKVGRGIQRQMRWEEVYADCDYPWGPKWPPPKDYGNYPQDLGVDSYASTAPVGSFRANLAGLFDLSGNVWEWCEDLYSDKDSARVYRGGSFAPGLIGSFPSWARGFGEPSERCVNRGFRVVLSESR